MWVSRWISKCISKRIYGLVNCRRCNMRMIGCKKHVLATFTIWLDAGFCSKDDLNPPLKMRSMVNHAAEPTVMDDCGI